MTYVLMALNIVAYVVEVVRSETVDRFGMVGAVLVDPSGERYYYPGGRMPGSS